MKGVQRTRKLEKCGSNLFSIIHKISASDVDAEEIEASHKISVSDVDAEEIEARLWPDNSSSSSEDLR